jgi:hypothetical protein
MILIDILAALVAAVAEIFFLMTMFTAGAVGLIAAALAFVMWLVIVGRAFWAHGAAGLWTLVSLPIAGYPFYLLWFLGNGCPGSSVCL